MHQIKNIRFKGYKVFPRNQYAEMENLSRVNVIIGKNNCGKTSLLDIIETIYNNDLSIKPTRDVEEIVVDAPIDDDMIRRVFYGYSGIGHWNQSNLSEHVKGRGYPFILDSNNSFSINLAMIRGLGSHINPACSEFSNRKRYYKFRKITAERNIYPEPEGKEKLYSDGEGASNLIATFLNDSLHDESIIEDTFLNALNRIMQPESEFVSIRVQQVTYNNQRLWEVFLQEKGFQRVPLSKSGSGLKTIVLQSGEDMYFNAAARYIQNGSYDEALNVLKSISNHNGKWYYYSAIAHYGKGNQATALEHIQRAMNIEPDNIEYQSVYSQMKNGSNWYHGMGRTYTMPTMGGGGYCFRLCLANLLCNMCCGSGGLCCGRPYYFI